VTTSPEAEDAVTEMLEQALGQPASSFTDAETRRTTVAVHCQSKLKGWESKRTELRAGIKRIGACGLSLGPGKISLAKVRAENWAESWKRHFRPLDLGPALLIKPSWNRLRPRKGQAAVVLDPGLSFGTGQHPTTAFCLRQLVARRRGGAAQSFLDIGTGSGLLAIAAAKLGYAPVQAFDFDPEAVRIAAANARRNRVAGRMRLTRRDVTKLPRRTADKFSLVCANLISNLLIAERARILARLRGDGVLVLAGILATEFARVQKAYEAAGLRLVAGKTEKEWRSGAFVWINQRRL